MRPLPFSDVAHALPFWCTYLLWFVPEIARSRTRRAGHDAAVRDDRGSYAVVLIGVYLGVFAAFALAFASPRATLPGNLAGWFAGGIVLMLAGVVLRAWSVRSLGPAFTLDVAVGAGQKVCDRGPYRWVRHPGYAATLLTLAGLGVALGNWASAVAAPLCAGIPYCYRIAVEERLLRASLGQAYVAYSRRRARLVPFIF